MCFISIFLDWHLGFWPTLQLKSWILRAFQNETHMRASWILNTTSILCIYSGDASLSGYCRQVKSLVKVTPFFFVNLSQMATPYYRRTNLASLTVYGLITPQTIVLIISKTFPQFSNQWSAKFLGTSGWGPSVCNFASPTGYMFKFSGFPLLNWSMFYRFL